MTASIRTIVAAIADLQPPYDVLPQAIALAEQSGATLHLVHAFDLPDTSWDIYARIGFPDATSLRQHAALLREQMEARVRTLSMRDRIHCHALSGSPPAAVQAVISREKPDLVVIGATRHGRIGQAILGTTAQRVLRAASVPVLVLRGTLPAHLNRVLLTTDLSRFSAGIHERGLDLVESLFGDRDEVRSLLVLPFGTEFPPVLSADRLHASAGAEIVRFLAERRPRTRECEGVVRMGEPAAGIEAECHAWEPDLLVLGTHGRSTAQRWVLGSVAEASLRSVGVNVLVLPARGMEEQPGNRDALRADPTLPPQGG